MDYSTLVEEYNYFIDLAPSEAGDICEQDVEQLKNPYPDSRIVKNVRDTFLSLFLGNKYLDDESIERVLVLPPLQWDFIEETEIISDSLFVVSLRGMKFFMKREEYTRHTDWTLHEYFVGFNLPRLPTLALVLGAYSCNFDGKQTCKYQSTTEDGLNFVLYEYLDGKTLSDFYKDLVAKSVKTPEWYVWNMVRIVWETINHLFLSVRFIHQDLHFGNIIVVDLGEEMNIKIGGRLFTTRYLPKIIDYGRSQITVNGKVYSPIEPEFNIPSITPFHDLRYLLRSFNVINDFIVWDKMGFGNNKQTFDEYTEVIFNMSGKELLSLYNEFDKIYPEHISLDKKELMMDFVSTTNNYEPCLSLPPPGQRLKTKYREENLYYRYLREYEKFLEDIRTNDDIYEVYLSLKNALQLKINKRLEKIELEDIIDSIFIGEENQILIDIEKTLRKDKFEELNDLYDKYVQLKNE